MRKIGFDAYCAEYAGALNMRKIACIIFGIGIVLLAGCHDGDPIELSTIAASVPQSTQYMIYSENYGEASPTTADADDRNIPIVLSASSDLDFSYSTRTEITNEKAMTKKEFVFEERSILCC